MPPVLPAAQVTEVEDVLGGFCRREPPPHVRAQLEYAVRITGNAVTLVELRPAFHADIGRTESPVARFRFSAKDGSWQLYWRDRNLRWHRYERIQPARHLATLFAEVQRDPTGIFWG
jgi:hypothetical protein